MRTLLRVFFHFLYHQFAFTYDLVAAGVSFGHWKNWILEIVPFIQGTRTLELGHGPGHLHRFLLNRGLVAVAMDESVTMGRLAMRNTNGSDTLTRGLAQHLPFPDGSFDTIIATFPSEYIADPLTLSEVERCLADGGRFIVLPATMPKSGLLQWLYRVTGETPPDVMEVIKERMEKPFTNAGFDVETHLIERESGTLVVLVAKKIS